MHKNKNGILTMFILAGIVVLLLWFVYFPKAGEVKRLGMENKKIKKDIAELYNFIGGEENLKDNLIKMRSYASSLENTLSSEKEASNIIRQLNEEAEDLKVSVVSIKPGDMVNYTNIQGSQIKISDYLCKSMPMNLNVEARYQAIGDFLNKIEINRNPLISVKRIEMRKDVNISPKIKADIELSACVLGE